MKLEDDTFWGSRVRKRYANRAPTDAPTVARGDCFEDWLGTRGRWLGHTCSVNFSSLVFPQ